MPDSSRFGAWTFLAVLARMPMPADALPSRAVLKALPSAIRNEPGRSLVESPILIGVSFSGRSSTEARGAITARSLRGSAARISASNSRRPAEQTQICAAPRREWNVVRISFSPPITTPELKSPGAARSNLWRRALSI